MRYREEGVKEVEGEERSRVITFRTQHLDSSTPLEIRLGCLRVFHCVVNAWLSRLKQRGSFTPHLGIAGDFVNLST